MTHRSKQKAVNTGTFGEGMFNVPKQLTENRDALLLRIGTVKNANWVYARHDVLDDSPAASIA
jgi:hypothetical protein